MSYICYDCDMTIENLICSKCDQELIQDEVEIDGETIQVAKCTRCEGMIKSPECCGRDMHMA